MAYVTRKKKRIRSARIFKTVFWVGVFAGLFYGGMTLLGSWNALTVKEIIVKGLSRHPIPREISALKGANLLKTDAAMIRKIFLDYQDIKEVHVRKAYPDRIIITVFQRKPLGLVKAGQEKMCIDEEGVLFPETGSERLPVIKGEASLTAGLKLLMETGKRKEFIVRELSCANPYEVVATIEDKTGRVIMCNFGKEAFRKKAEALAALIENNDKKFYVDLRFIPYVVVRNGGGD